MTLRRKVRSVRAGARRRARRAFYDVARRFTPYVAARTENAVYLVRTGDTSFGPKLFAKGVRKETRVLARTLELLDSLGLQHRGTFLDVGAHVGTTTVEALGLGFERAVALEPGETNRRLLVANLALNGFDLRARVIGLAASDTVGTATLALGAGSSTKARIVTGPTAGAQHSIGTTTLDTLVADGVLDPGDVGLFWMDVEGYEAHALAGATRLLEQGVPIVSELNPKLLDPAGRADDLRTLLEPHYTHVLDLRRVRERELRPIADIDALLDEYRPNRLTDVLVVRLADGR